MIIDQDLHIHTHLSPCGDCPESTIAAYKKEARAFGVTTLGITDHFREAGIPGGNAWYDKLDFNHISRIRAEIAGDPDRDVRVLFGAEAEYSPEIRDIAISEEHAKELDFFIVPHSHTHVIMPVEYRADHNRHIDFMITAFHDITESKLAKYVTAIAHPFEAGACSDKQDGILELISDDQFRDCFRKAAEKDIAVEINLGTLTARAPRYRESRFFRMFEIARDCGCKFTFGSDSHRPKHFSSITQGYAWAALLGLTDQDIRRV